jgi:hemerythrin-like metal-binding protein
MATELHEWTKSYELGIEDIDFQHHFFFNLILRLSKELQEAHDPQYRAALLSELNAYARFHFISEENLMTRTGFPERVGHHYLHLELLDQLSVNGNMFSLAQSQQSSQDMITFLVEWFINHTMRVDRLFADYLHARNGNAPPSGPSAA